MSDVLKRLEEMGRQRKRADQRSAAIDYYAALVRLRGVRRTIELMEERALLVEQEVTAVLDGMVPESDWERDGQPGRTDAIKDLGHALQSVAGGCERLARELLPPPTPNPGRDPAES